MNTAEISALLLLCSAASFTPGPNTTLSTALAANFGFRRSLSFVFAVPASNQSWPPVLLTAWCWGRV